jgi:hypothetical protein
MVSRAALVALIAGSLATGTSVANAAPASGCGPANYAAAIYNQSGATLYQCSPGIARLTPRTGWDDLTITGPDRVWLHQDYPAIGWAECFHIAAGSFIAIWPLNPAAGIGSLQYTSNPAAC